MASYGAKTGTFNLRVVILRRLAGAVGKNNETAETWPEPAPNAGGRYSAAREAMSAGETITQGVRQSTGSMKLRIKGRAIPVDARDRLRVEATGELFEITGLYRDSSETVLTVERLRSQAAQQ